MAATARLFLSPVSLSRNPTPSLGNRHVSSYSPSFPSTPFPRSSPPPQFRPLPPYLIHKKPDFSCAAGGGNGSDGIGHGGNGGGGGSGGDGSNSDENEDGDKNADDTSWVGPIAAFMNGWRSRVAADSQFPFKVLMEELVGVTACVLGDMASRPNFGLNELDFVFSTLVVGSILNFVLMYLLAPTLSASASTLPSIFASCPTSHMFEPGPYNPLHRIGTFVYKGALFAVVGFFAGLVGTALSNGLMKVRKKMDPDFETPNKAPPTLLNAGTWALHMGLSSNFRYQTLNGTEFVLAGVLPPAVFKTSVVVLRCLNNVLGGMSFVVLARLTGSQSSESGKEVVLVANEEQEKLVEKTDGSLTNQSG